MRVASVEALGTWVGGLATAVGLVFAGMQLRQNRTEAEERQRLYEKHLRVRARLITISAAPHTAEYGRLNQVRVEVANKSDEYVTDIQLFVGKIPIGETKEQVHPDRNWIWKLPTESLPIRDIPARPAGPASEDRDLIRKVRAELLPLLRIQYTIGNVRFERDHKDVDPLPYSG